MGVRTVFGENVVINFGPAGVNTSDTGFLIGAGSEKSVGGTSSSAAFMNAAQV